MTDIMKDNTIVDNESDKDNTLCIALLYRYRTNFHDRTVDRTSVYFSCKFPNHEFKAS